MTTTVQLVDPFDDTDVFKVTRDTSVTMDEKQVSLHKVIVEFFTMSSILEIGTKTKEYIAPNGSKYYLTAKRDGVYQVGDGQRRVQITVDTQVELDDGPRGNFRTTNLVSQKKMKIETSFETTSLGENRAATRAATRAANDSRHQPTNLLGCRVKYVDSNGTSFGYVSHDKGDKVIVQNPWKKFETVPILKERVQPVRKEDWNNVIHPETGNSIWAIETESSTDEMFKFYDMSPKTCV